MAEWNQRPQVSRSSRPKASAHPASTASATPASRHWRRAASTPSSPTQKMPFCSRSSTASPSRDAPATTARRDAPGARARASPSATGSTEAFSLMARGAK
ncbi:hypothetical protein COSO111634_37060 [Corallococcus soli]